MTTLINSDGKELEIARSSYVYMRNEAGVDVYREWADLSEAERAKYEKVVEDINQII